MGAHVDHGFLSFSELNDFETFSITPLCIVHRFSIFPVVAILEIRVMQAKLFFEVLSSPTHLQGSAAREGESCFRVFQRSLGQGMSGMSA